MSNQPMTKSVLPNQYILKMIENFTLTNFLYGFYSNFSTVKISSTLDF